MRKDDELSTGRLCLLKKILERASPEQLLAVRAHLAENAFSASTLCSLNKKEEHFNLIMKTFDNKEYDNPLIALFLTDSFVAKIVSTPRNMNTETIGNCLNEIEKLFQHRLTLNDSRNNITNNHYFIKETVKILEKFLAPLKFD